MPLQATSGAASYDAFGGGVPVVPNYIEEVFSTYLYTGTGSAQTITNNIDLSTNGGMVWFKARNIARNHSIIDTARGTGKVIYPEYDFAQDTATQTLTAFNTAGFSIGTSADVNASGDSLVSWTFRKQPKFFDIVTWTGDGANRTISHSLGSVPACIMVKRLNATSAWQVYHSSLANTEYMVLNTTAAKATGTTRWNSTTPTSTVFSLGTDASVNASGSTYVAYLFAHDAGGFGLTGTDNVISCGSFTTDGSAAATVNLGYEPQWILYRRIDTGSWLIADNMRGNTANASSNTNYLLANTSGAEANTTWLFPTATGFTGTNGITDTTFIYIAIRRGPMKVPTLGTSVFSPVARTGTGATANVTGVGFAPDFLISKNRTSSFQGLVVDKLRGSSQRIMPDATNAEDSQPDAVTAFLMDGISVGTDGTGAINYAGGGDTYITYFFRRATSFFDEVCYTGSSSTQTVTHNLGVAPELIIVKKRSGGTARGWAVYPNDPLKRLILNSNVAASFDASYWNDTAATSSVFTVASSDAVNGSGFTFVAYLFATTAGVSKVGSYTGTATTKQIDCGFTGGARFVLIKRTDSTGDWYVWDTARGIVSGNDSYLLLNSTAAEVTNTDYIDTYSAGFEISSTAPAAINASGGSYIFLAIA